jgi:peptidoglycan/xylan/chitin deacetylase (PgdA/CDA1 family)
VAITIDDLPLNGPNAGITQLRAMTDKLLLSIKKARVPVVGFVNENQLYVQGETDARIAVLHAWVDAGVELGNHTFSHIGFKEASLALYEDDFLRGDTVTRMLMKRRGLSPRFFRHPYLQMGQTRELESQFEIFIGERGYRIAPVTIDPMDWMIVSAYRKAAKSGDSKMQRLVAEEYLKFLGERIDFADRTANGLFGRPIDQIILMHSNELNADNFDGVLKVFRDRGYHFITLDEALKDEAYRFPDKYTATSDWLLNWSLSKGERFEPPPPPEFLSEAAK